MEEIVVPIVAVGVLFLGLPWLIFHYVTQWKRAGTLTMEDERLMDELYEHARRLDDRLATIERIIAADNPDYRALPRAERDMGPRLEKSDDLDEYRRRAR